MKDRRLEPRMLCADLIGVHWTDRSGESKLALANLEDISNSGACLQLDAPVPAETVVRLEHADVELEGRVRYCVFGRPAISSVCSSNRGRAGRSGNSVRSICSTRAR